MNIQTSIMAMGEALVEIMRVDRTTPLDGTGTFEGPYASGAPAIFAVAAARLGLPVAFAGSVGPDAFGRFLRAYLQREGVDCSLLRDADGKATGAAFVAYQPDGGREFVFHIRDAAAGAMDPSHLPQERLRTMSWLHISGSTLALNDGWRAACRAALAAVLAGGGRLSFDPNLRPELLPLEEARLVFAPYLEAASLILPTREEALALSGQADLQAAAQSLAHPGCLVAIKRGAEGCFLYRDGEAVDQAGFAVEEVDPTGAGDCFNAACIFGLSQNWSMAQTAHFAAAAGALAVTRMGPMEGAPGLEAVNALLTAQG